MLLAIQLQAQNEKISINASGVPLSEVISRIEAQYNYIFIYKTEDIDVSRTVTVKEENASIETVLAKVLDPGTSFKISGRQVVLVSKPQGAPAKPQDSGPFKVSGKISDKLGPVAGAAVMEIGTSNGTVTDLDGNYTIEVSSPKSSLEISSLGYVTKTVAVNSSARVNAVLEEDSTLLEETVIVGYGYLSKKQLTGSVSVVKPGDIESKSKSTISQSLAGRAAGLRVTQTTAQAGGASTFRIRGELSDMSNNPLIVIDGFPITESSSLSSGNAYETGSTDNVLGSINPDDIESITVLKDAASTAIYGSRAGHGVILINTKRGLEDRPMVSYSSNFTVQTIAKQYEMLSCAQFMDMRNRQAYEEYLSKYALGIYQGYVKAPSGNIPEFEPFYTQDEILHSKGTDWVDEISRTGIMHQHNLSVRGGSQKFKYMVSGNYMSQEGIIKGNDASRIALRTNLDWDFSKYISAGANASYSLNKYDNIPLGNGEYEDAGILRSAARFNPALPIFDSKGEYMLDPEHATATNPVSMLEITDISRHDNLMGNAYVDIKPVDGLVLRLKAGAERMFQKRSSYLPTTTLEGKRNNGEANIRQRDNTNILAEVTATYSKSFGDHSLKTLAGYSYEKHSYEYVSAANTDFMIDGSLYYQLGSGQAEKPEVGSNGGYNSLASAFFRVNYDYDRRYLFEASLRTDGDSNFHPDYRWGFFPSVSVGWAIHREPFMESVPWVSTMKLRASFGETGNSNVPFQIYDAYSIQFPSAVIGDSIAAGITDSTIGNKKLTWETTQEINIGLDAGFLKDRFSFSLEYYRRTIRDMITYNNLMYYFPVSQVVANGGKTLGTGVELTVNSTNIQTKDFQWNTTFTFTHSVDKWLVRSPYWKGKVYESVTDEKSAWWSYHSLGLMQVGDKVPVHQSSLLPGMVVLEDVDGNGVLEDDDMIYMGSSAPDGYIGFNNSFRYKDFDLSLYFYGAYGMTRGASYIENWTSMYQGYNVTKYAYESYCNSNTTATRPSYLHGGNGFGDYYVKDVWYIRCGNITLGYNIPFKKVVSSARVFLETSNPFVFTNWEGLDPETDNLTFSYPNTRSFTFGVNINF